MKTRTKTAAKITRILLALCILSAGVFTCVDQVYAAKLSSVEEAEKKALEKVPGATVTDSDSDDEDGELVYEVELKKGNREYELEYRASDAKLIAYGWEKISVSPQKDKSLIGKDKCKELAQEKVKGATILKVTQKVDDGIDIYKVKMRTSKKKYTLKYHARTGELLEYKWELR